MGHIPFQLWEIEVQLKEQKGVVTMREDLGAPTLIEQELEYTLTSHS